MTTNEFAKYVIDNIHRATLSNSLNIANKFDKEYLFKEFIKDVEEYVIKCVENKKIDNINYHKIFAIDAKYVSLYDSEIKYNNQMIFDNYIIELWETFSNGH